MAAKGEKKLIREIDSKETFENVLSDPSKLFIVDIFDEWYGPCAQMEPTFKSFSQNTDYFDMRAAFLQIEIKIIPEFIEKYGPPNKPKSKALFLFYRAGKIVGETFGCDAPLILKTIEEHMPVYTPAEE